MSISRASTGDRRALQGLWCALGYHALERVGEREETGYRFSDAHDAVYLVRQHTELLRCAHCAKESQRSGRLEQTEFGHYERRFVRLDGG